MRNDWLIPILVDENCKSFIDVGCGFGGICGMVKELLPRTKVVGIDIAKAFIDEAKKKWPKVVFKVKDIRDYRIKGFDIAHTNGTLIHIPHEDIEETIWNIMFKLKVGLFTESMGKDSTGTLKYEPKAYWNYRAGREEPDLIDWNTPYYFSHNYPKLFKKIGLKHKIIKDWGDKGLTRLYYVTKT